MTGWYNVDPKHSGKKSKEQWQALWRRALEAGVCPFESCDIRTSTCEHLDNYLEWGSSRKFFEPRLRAESRDDIDEFPELAPCLSNTEGIWALFRHLRKLPLENDQIRILIRKYGLGQGRPLIMRELGWKSVSHYQRRLRLAVETLRSEIGET